MSSMKMKSVWHIFLFQLFFMPIAALAGTEVLEGQDAEYLMKEHQSSAAVLSQKNKVFVLNKSDGEKVQNPQEITVKVGEYFFITNEEDRTVHNVYDLVDRSWVLKKQIPGGIAAIKFNEAKMHKLNCAIHPQMRVTVNVVE